MLSSSEVQSIDQLVISSKYCAKQTSIHATLCIVMLMDLKMLSCDAVKSGPVHAFTVGIYNGQCVILSLHWPVFSLVTLELWFECML